MSFRYTLAESPHRWTILAGISFVAALFGTILIFAFAWPHTLASIWLYAGLLLTLAFLVAAFKEWRDRMEEMIEAAGDTAMSPSPSVRTTDEEQAG